MRFSCYIFLVVLPFLILQHSAVRVIKQPLLAPIVEHGMQGSLSVDSASAGHTLDSPSIGSLQPSPKLCGILDVFRDWLSSRSDATMSRESHEMDAEVDPVVDGAIILQIANEVLDDLTENPQKLQGLKARDNSFATVGHDRHEFIRVQNHKAFDLIPAIFELRASSLHHSADVQKTSQAMLVDPALPRLPEEFFEIIKRIDKLCAIIFPKGGQEPAYGSEEAHEDLVGPRIEDFRIQFRCAFHARFSKENQFWNVKETTPELMDLSAQLPLIQERLAHISHLSLCN
ncbi:hypothetical protein PGTUg99_034786 [Puccinia graminis f. sp. tritici]|uniref:Uncharacterized protein n=1 Tax=Puccinia graminis f. sp. tritici TaxID=56615 RepID=A0A5B0SPW1_PUCGR|nr:hypothetical protein PGTUg99_034786 [Puccinia graminis f. sp. tritici]